MLETTLLTFPSTGSALEGTLPRFLFKYNRMDFQGLQSKPKEDNNSLATMQSRSGLEVFGR